MNLPNVISDLLKAQSNFDSNAYANCFAETAIVFDEGKTYNGKSEIKTWNEESNSKYKATMEPLDFAANENESILSANISGDFVGSPIVLQFHFEIKNDQITRLEITA